ncbi:MAG: protein BatD [Deltaproteobacteria bacterium]|nr:protein BatD [Deltaproteobacteria bacterium]
MSTRAMTALLAGFATLSAGAAHAADALTVTAELSERQVLVGDVVTLQIRAVATVNGDIQVQVPRVDGLSELSRSSSEGTSISFSSVGGQQVRREQTVAVELQADKAGTLSVPAVVARVGGQQARSQPLTLVVVGQEDLQSGAAVAPGEVVPPDPNEQSLFARYRVDRSQAYLGQQIVVDLEIFASPRGNFSLEEVPKPPELDGFWSEILYKPERLTRSVEKVAGKSYHVYRLWRVALFPLTAGEASLPPVRVTYSTGRGMFGGGKRGRVRTKPVALEILPLPTQGRPSDFVSTNVGSYSLSASVDANKVPAGKAVVLKVQLRGDGNIKNAKLPELPELDGFRAFPPTVSSDAKPQLAGMTGSKTAEILLMPTRGGRLSIPGLSLPVFDPVKKAYERLTTPSIPVVVEGEPAPAAAPPPTVGATPAPVPQDQLRPIRFRSDLLATPAPPSEQAWYWAVVASVPVLFLLLLGLERLIRGARAETPERRRRAVARGARARLAEARRLAEAGQGAEAYAAFTDALFDLGTERLQVALRGLTTEQIVATLKARGASDELAQRVQHELEQADYARYVPGVASGVAGSLEAWEGILSEVGALGEKKR